MKYIYSFLCVVFIGLFISAPSSEKADSESIMIFTRISSISSPYLEGTDPSVPEGMAITELTKKYRRLFPGEMIQYVGVFWEGEPIVFNLIMAGAGTKRCRYKLAEGRKKWFDGISVKITDITSVDKRNKVIIIWNRKESSTSLGVETDDINIVDDDEGVELEHLYRIDVHHDENFLSGISPEKIERKVETISRYFVVFKAVTNRQKALRLVNMARRALREDDIERARMMLAEAKKMDDSLFETRLLLSGLHYHDGDLEKAMDLLREAKSLAKRQKTKREMDVGIRKIIREIRDRESKRGKERTK